MTSEKSYATEQRLNQLRSDLSGYATTGSLSSYELHSALGPFAEYNNQTSWTDTGGLSNGWGKGASGFFKYMRFFSNVWFVAAHGLTVGTTTDNTTILTNAAFGIAAATNHYLPAYADVIKLVTGSNSEAAALRFNTDGTVSCYGIASTATIVDCYGILFVDI